MAKLAIRTTDAPQPVGPYSQGIEINGFVFTAGFGPQAPANGGAVAEGVADQTRQVLRNIRAVLAQRGLTMDDCVKTTVHLADLADFDAFNQAYGEFFNEPYPVRTTVGSPRGASRLALAGRLARRAAATRRLQPALRAPSLPLSRCLGRLRALRHRAIRADSLCRFRPLG